MHDRLAQDMGIQIDDQLIIRPNVTSGACHDSNCRHLACQGSQEDFWFGDPDGQLKRFAARAPKRLHQIYPADGPVRFT